MINYFRLFLTLQISNSNLSQPYHSMFISLKTVFCGLYLIIVPLYTKTHRGTLTHTYTHTHTPEIELLSIFARVVKCTQFIEINYKETPLPVSNPSVTDDRGTFVSWRGENRLSAFKLQYWLHVHFYVPASMSVRRPLAVSTLLMIANHRPLLSVAAASVLLPLSADRFSPIDSVYCTQYTFIYKAVRPFELLAVCETVVFNVVPKKLKIESR